MEPESGLPCRLPVTWVGCQTGGETQTERWEDVGPGAGGEQPAALSPGLGTVNVGGLSRPGTGS